MDEYIKREYAADAVLDVYCDTPDINLSCEKFEAAILKIPVADVAPVRHGRWEKVAWWQHKNHYECNECSVCGCRVKPKFTYNYCPNCGAKMDGNADD